MEIAGTGFCAGVQVGCIMTSHVISSASQRNDDLNCAIEKFIWKFY